MLVVAGKGIDALDRYIARLGDGANKAAVMAVNDTADWARTRIKRQMQAEVTLAESAFSNRQFYVSRRANTADLQAILTASRQPYSLSRFKVGDVGFGPSAGPVKVRIKAGGSTVNLKRAFYVRAPNGAVGIAVRSKQPLDNSRGARRIKGTDVYVLFGPSPDQLMRRLAPASVPDVENYLNREFSRQIVRVING